MKGYIRRELRDSKIVYVYYTTKGEPFMYDENKVRLERVLRDVGLMPKEEMRWDVNRT